MVLYTFITKGINKGFGFCGKSFFFLVRESRTDNKLQCTRRKRVSLRSDSN